MLIRRRIQITQVTQRIVVTNATTLNPPEAPLSSVKVKFFKAAWRDGARLFAYRIVRWILNLRFSRSR